MKNKGLGRGFDSVFDDNMLETSGKGTSVLRVADIEPRKNQPRKVFDDAALSELAASIAQHGLIQPVVVRDDHTGFYSIIAGERRWRASKMAGLTEIPVVILDVDEAHAAELALIENIQREDLNPIEEAMAYRALIDEFGLTQEKVAEKVGKNRSTITNSLRLLNLPPEIYDLLATGQLSQGHARALLGIKDPSKVADAAKSVVSRDLNVRDTEALVRKLNKPEKPAEPQSEGIKINYRRELEVAMTRKMGRVVHIKDSGKQKKLEITYTDNDDLQELVTALCGKVFASETENSVAEGDLLVGNDEPP